MLEGGAGRLEASLPWLSSDILKSVFRDSLTQRKILLNTQTRTWKEAPDSWPSLGDLLFLRASWKGVVGEGLMKTLCKIIAFLRFSEVSF